MISMFQKSANCPNCLWKKHLISRCFEFRFNNNHSGHKFTIINYFEYDNTFFKQLINFLYFV